VLRIASALAQMEIEVVDTSPAEVDADVLVFAVADPVELSSTGEELDRLVAGELRHLIDEGELKGRRGKVTVVHTDGRLPAHRVAAAGVGPRDRIDPDSLRTAAAAAALRAGDVGARSVAWIVGENGLGLEAAQEVTAIVEGTALGPHDMGRWKTKAEDPRREVERLILCGPGAAAVA
jgi:leucyl aminopeptidase